MKCITTALPGVLVLEPRVFGDERGFFFESFSTKTLHELGIDLEWVQDNHSRSAMGVLRGLHWQTGAAAQDKLVRVVAGAVFDVAVDLRRSSPTFGAWYGIELSALNKRQLLVPKGCAHGFLTLEDRSEFLYKCSTPYQQSAERGLLWNDGRVGIAWPSLVGVTPQLNQRDQGWPTFAAIAATDLFS